MIAFIFFSLMLVLSLGGMFIKYVSSRHKREWFDDHIKESQTGKVKFIKTTPDIERLLQEIEKVENGTYSN